MQNSQQSCPSAAGCSFKCPGHTLDVLTFENYLLLRMSEDLHIWVWFNFKGTPRGSHYNPNNFNHIMVLDAQTNDPKSHRNKQLTREQRQSFMSGARREEIHFDSFVNSPLSSWKWCIQGLDGKSGGRSGDKRGQGGWLMPGVVTQG